MTDARTIDLFLSGRRMTASSNFLAVISTFSLFNTRENITAAFIAHQRFSALNLRCSLECCGSDRSVLWSYWLWIHPHHNFHCCARAASTIRAVFGVVIIFVYVRSNDGPVRHKGCFPPAVLAASIVALQLTTEPYFQLSSFLPSAAGTPVSAC